MSETFPFLFTFALWAVAVFLYCQVRKAFIREK